MKFYDFYEKLFSAGFKEEFLASVRSVDINFLTSSALDEEDLYDLFTVSVEYRGSGRWAVVRQNWCWDKNLTKEREGIPSGRTDEFLERFRFDDFLEAVSVAEQVAWDVPLFRKQSGSDVVLNGFKF